MTSAQERVPLLRMRGITKRFPGTLALDDVDLDVEAGTIHGLLGENGAGKSTLLKILAGDYPPTAGRIELDGEAVDDRDAGPRARARHRHRLPGAEPAARTSRSPTTSRSASEPTRGLVDRRADG